MIQEEIKGAPPTIKPNSIMIDNIEYTYSIRKLEDKEGVTIKLFEINPKTNIYYLYEDETSKLTKNIKVLAICEDVQEMINVLEDLFNQENVKFEKKENKYFIELKIGGIGKTEISEIELTKIKPKDKISELNDKIQILKINIMFSKNYLT